MASKKLLKARACSAMSSFCIDLHCDPPRDLVGLEDERRWTEVVRELHDEMVRRSERWWSAHPIPEEENGDG